MAIGLNVNFRFCLAGGKAGYDLTGNFSPIGHSNTLYHLCTY